MASIRIKSIWRYVSHGDHSGWVVVYGSHPDVKSEDQTMQSVEVKENIQNHYNRKKFGEHFNAIMPMYGCYGDNFILRRAPDQSITIYGEHLISFLEIWKPAAYSTPMYGMYGRQSKTVLSVQDI